MEVSSSAPSQARGLPGPSPLLEKVPTSCILLCVSPYHHPLFCLKFAFYLPPSQSPRTCLHKGPQASPVLHVILPLPPTQDKPTVYFFTYIYFRKTEQNKQPVQPGLGDTRSENSYSCVWFLVSAPGPSWELPWALTSWLCS